MSKETPQDDPRQRDDWKPYPGSKEPWKQPAQSTQDPAAPREGGFFAYFHRMAELREELAEAGGRDVELVAVEGFGWLLDDLAGRMRSPEELIRAIRLTESEPSMLGVSAHVIGVARAAGSWLSAT